MIDLIPKGKDNAILLADLASIVGISPREVKKRIQILRESGTHILSSAAGGYYRPTNGKEGIADTRRYISMMETQAKGRFKTIRTAKRWLREQGQQCIEETTPNE